MGTRVSGHLSNQTNKLYSDKALQVSHVFCTLSNACHDADNVAETCYDAYLYMTRPLICGARADADGNNQYLDGAISE